MICLFFRQSQHPPGRPTTRDVMSADGQVDGEGDARPERLRVTFFKVLTLNIFSLFCLLFVCMLTTSISQIQCQCNSFAQVDSSLETVWTQFVEQSEEKHFRKYVAGVVGQWERQVAPNWHMLIAGRLQGHREEGPSLSDMPDELLVACSKFLIIAKDSAEQGDVSARVVNDAKAIVKCLTILCRFDQKRLSTVNMSFAGNVITFHWCLRWILSH